MIELKFILRAVGYAIGKIAGLVLALWLVSCKTTHPVRYSPINEDVYYATADRQLVAPKSRWFYYQIKNNPIDSVYCVRLHLDKYKGCLYAEYETPAQKQLIHCGTVKVINR